MPNAVDSGVWRVVLNEDTVEQIFMVNQLTNQLKYTATHIYLKPTTDRIPQYNYPYTQTRSYNTNPLPVHQLPLHTLQFARYRQRQAHRMQDILARSDDWIKSLPLRPRTRASRITPSARHGVRLQPACTCSGPYM